MRHRLSGRHFGRTAAHRSALYRSLALALFKYEVIKTTLPKAKELRRFAEPLITLAKQDSVAHRRLAFARLRDPAVVAKLFKSIAPACAERQGGYTRILKCGLRQGDKAPMAYVMLVDRTPDEAGSKDIPFVKKEESSESAAPAETPALTAPQSPAGTAPAEAPQA